MQLILYPTGNLLTMHAGENNQNVLNCFLVQLEFCVTWVSILKPYGLLKLSCKELLFKSRTDFAKRIGKKAFFTCQDKEKNYF